MNCPSCGQANREGRKFCASCGAQLALACPSCNASNEPGERFCGECGQSLSADSPPAVTRTPTPAPSPALPASFAGGRYQVQRFLGEGGRKRVYLAHDERLDRDVAVAVIKTEGLDEEGLARVRREAQAMGRLGDHQNIVTIHDIGDEDPSPGSGQAPQPYIVSQYMAGGDLDGLLREAEGRRLPLDRAVDIANQVRRGLEHAHSRGIVHRDLKPGNIWLDDEGTAKIGDFGLAVALDRSRMTMEGMMVGTVAYMPPEQALGRQPDARSDLYSLGCVLYEMLTGRPPFLGDDSVAIISQHINTAPVAPSWHNPDVPKTLEALIMRLLAKDPAERPESAAAIPEALTSIMQQASSAPSTEQEANPLDRLAGGVFVGREKEMDELRAGLEEALSGRGRLLMLVGEPGIGKTRTSEEFATYAGLRSVQVLWGRCYEGEGAPAYWPWVQLIRSYVHDRDPQELASEMGPGAADIAEVVSEVRERLPGLPQPPTLEPEQARFRLFDSITTFFRNASNAKPIVLVLDDLHWADKPSLLLLQFLARELRQSRLTVLGTYRDVELRRQHPLSQTLAELARENLSQRILLRGLTQRDVARFIEITAGVEPPQALVEAVYRETEGNPFFVNEVVRLLVADGRLEEPETVTSWSVTIPQGVREVVGRRLDHLSEECNRVLTLGSVIGRDFSLATLERVSDLSSDRLLEALEEAVAARVIAEKRDAVEEYTFTHALIKETLYEELSTARRVRAHRQIGEVLEAGDGETPDAILPQLAYHFCEAAQGGDVDKAIDYATRAARRAGALMAHEEAAQHYERALQVLELAEPVDERKRCEMLVELGDAQWKAGDTPTAEETFLRAAELAKSMGDAELLGGAAIGYGEIWWVAGNPNETLMALLDAALEALPRGDSALRARLISRRAWSLYFSAGERDQIPILSDQAVEMARRLGDAATLSYTLSARYAALWGPGAIETRLETADELTELAEKAGDTRGVFFGRHFRLMCLLALADRPAVDREIELCTALADDLRQPNWHWQAAQYRVTMAMLEGRIADAERLALEAFAIGQKAVEQNARQMLGAQTFAIRYEQGRLAELEGPTKAFVDMYPAIPAWRSALALLYALTDQRDKAKEQFEIIAADDFKIVPDDANQPIAVALLAQVCAELDDRVRAAPLYEMASGYGDQCIVIGAGSDCYGSMARLSGVLATVMERWDDAERHFAEAMAMNERMVSRRWILRTKQDQANMLLRRDRPGDREKALELLSEAIDGAQECGMGALVERCVGLKLEAQGVSSTDIATSIDAVASAVYVDKPDLRPQAAPDGTVTILFSDIEGSTEKTEALGDRRWMEVLREHNAIVREHVQRHGGFEVKSEGDGFMLAFQSARRGIECAVDIQRALAQRNESAEEPIRVRMGLHTGEVIKEGEDFFGRHVNLAARVAGQASGGEILVSSLLKDLTESGGDIAFADGREVELKGLSSPQRIFAVAWA